jgi:hypothetical protein
VTVTITGWPGVVVVNAGIETVALLELVRTILCNPTDSSTTVSDT